MCCDTRLIGGIERGIAESSDRGRFAPANDAGDAGRFASLIARGAGAATLGPADPTAYIAAILAEEWPTSPMQSGPLCLLGRALFRWEGF